MLAPSEDTADAASRREGGGVWAWPGQMWAWGQREAWAQPSAVPGSGDKSRPGQVSPVLPLTPAPVGACLACLARLVAVPTLRGVLVQPHHQLTRCPLPSLASALGL